MKRVLFLVVLFFSFVYVQGSYAQDTQDKYIELKVELEVLKNKANTTNEIQKDIKELEQKLNSLEQSTKINEQRFNDFNSGIGNYLTMFGILITVLLVLISIGTYFSAKNRTEIEIQAWKEKTQQDIQEWFETKGNKELEKLSSEAQVKINNHVERLEKDINNIRQKYEREFSLDKSKLTQQQMEQLQKDAQEILKIVEEKRSLQEWIDLCNAEKDNYRALEIAQKMKIYYPESGYFHIGYAYGRLEEYQKAIKAYQKAIEINPKRDIAYYNMGIAYGRLEEYQKAIEAYQKAIEINPIKDDAYLNLYELSMVQQIEVDTNIEYYLQNHSDVKVQMTYKMLQLFKEISEGKEVNFDEYFREYKDNLNELTKWSFNELEDLANQKDEPIKTNLLEAIKTFKTKLGQ